MDIIYIWDNHLPPSLIFQYDHEMHNSEIGLFLLDTNLEITFMPYVIQKERMKNYESLSLTSSRMIFIASIHLARSPGHR